MPFAKCFMVIISFNPQNNSMSQTSIALRGKYEICPQE